MASTFNALDKSRFAFCESQFAESRRFLLLFVISDRGSLDGVIVDGDW